MNSIAIDGWSSQLIFKATSKDEVFNKIKEIYKSIGKQDYWLNCKTYKDYEDSEIKRMTSEIDEDGNCYHAPFTLIDMRETGNIPYTALYDGGIDSVSEFNPDVETDDIEYIDDGTLRYIYGQQCYWVSNQQILTDKQSEIIDRLSGTIVMLTMSGTVPIYKFIGIASSIYEKSTRSRYINRELKLSAGIQTEIV